MKIIDGVLTDFFETGCEGVIWTVYEDGGEGYGGLNILLPGDYLTVFGENDEVLFKGVIDPDFEIGYRPYPQNRRYGQPCALGFWVHWTQRGWQPDDWARLFIRKEGEKPLRARLVKADRS